MTTEPKFVDATDEVGGFNPKERSEILRYAPLPERWNRTFHEQQQWNRSRVVCVGGTVVRPAR
ncbi:TPA: hypothetical protein EYP66_09470 [Candidatus Poribacteria bacterium]|nr:hypothetical protein [Candidatus Poribacteria bacterium]